MTLEYFQHLSRRVIIISVEVLLESSEHIIILVIDLPCLGPCLSLTPPPSVVIIDDTNIAVHGIICEVLGSRFSTVSTSYILETKYFSEMFLNNSHASVMIPSAAMVMIPSACLDSHLCSAVADNRKKSFNKT